MKKYIVIVIVFILSYLYESECGRAANKVFSRMVTRDCCLPIYNVHCEQKAWRAPCLDCTESTPYCAYGKCNIFGCNCDGGCRKRYTPKNVTETPITPKFRLGFLLKKKDPVEDPGTFSSKHLFSLFDKDQNNFITKPEFIDGFKNLFKNFNFSNLELEKYFKQIDVNNDGKISKDEFMEKIQ